MQNYYSFLGSPLHLLLEDDIAEGYNRFVDAFASGQIKFAEENGRKWQPTDAIWMDITDKDHDAFDKVGRIIDLLVEINGGGLSISEEDRTEDHLIKL
jgi:hypothetical protein